MVIFFLGSSQEQVVCHPGNVTQPVSLYLTGPLEAPILLGVLLGVLP